MSEAEGAPDVDYLTRDYEGFRHLLLALVDRSSTRWTERSAADLGVTLVEILAQQLDLLAYAGDRVAGEAFLVTARRRESARLHAALADYELGQGNATVGHQHFRLREGAALRLPVGTRVGRRLAPGQEPSGRLVAETTEDAALDARRNEFALARSAPEGGVVLHLAALDGSRPDLRALGLRPGMRLCLLDREAGEVVALRQVRASVVELAEPLGRTYLAGADGGVRVLGNLVPIRRGETSDWRLVGFGGVRLEADMPAGGEGPVEAAGPARVVLTGLIDLARRLRDEVESARGAWVGDERLAGDWHRANARVSHAVRRLREAGGAISAEEAKELDEALRQAAERFRELLRASNRAVAEALRPTLRVAQSRQEIDVPHDPHPPLWLGGAAMLQVCVGIPGRWEAWTEVKDFLRSAPDDRHYVAQVGAGGVTTLRFGDGVNGAVLPADRQVVVRRVTGDPDVGNLGPRVLEQLVHDEGPGGSLDAGVFDPEVPTFNPLATSEGEPPEKLGGLDQRVRSELQRRVVPVSERDYVTVLKARCPDVAEASVRVARRRVEIVLRPRPGADATRTLKAARALLREARLVGTDVWVRLAEPLYVSLELVVETHPEIRPSELRLRLRRKLIAAFAGGQELELGRERTRAEIYALVESEPGVNYAEVLGFDLASRPEGHPAPREAISPAWHQIVRCLDLPGVRLGGAIRIWQARRFSLELELAYPEPDKAPDVERLRAAVEGLLSGRDAAPIRDRWGEITSARIDALLLETAVAGASNRLRVRRLIVGERAVERMPIGPDELPIVDRVQVRERRFLPRYGLVVEVSGGGAPGREKLRDLIEARLSGPQSVPVTAGEPWTEIDPPRVDAVLAEIARDGGYTLKLRALTVAARESEAWAPALPPGVALLGERRVVPRVPLLPESVPVLDALQIVTGTEGP